MAQISGIILNGSTLFGPNLPVLLINVDTLEAAAPFTQTDANGYYQFNNIPVGYTYAVLFPSSTYNGINWESVFAQVAITQDVAYTVNLNPQPIGISEYVLEVGGSIAPVPVIINGVLAGYISVVKKGYPQNTSLTVSVAHPSLDRFFVKWFSSLFPTVDGKTTTSVTFTLNTSGDILAIWEPIRKITFQSNKAVSCNYSYTDFKTGNPVSGVISIGGTLELFEQETLSLSLTVPSVGPDDTPFTQWEDDSTNLTRTFPYGITTDKTFTAYYGTAPPSCATHFDCPAGFVCVANQCVPHEPCPPGTQWNDSVKQCVPIVPTECPFENLKQFPTLYNVLCGLWQSVQDVKKRVRGTA